MIELEPTISVLIANEEPLARGGLRRQLESETDIRILGECSDGPTTVRLVRELQPELLLMDILMPGLDGFGVVNSVGNEKMPVLVFVTSHQEYALQAFSVNALDYILRPWEPPRFQSMLQRARETIRMKRQQAGGQHVRSLLEQIRCSQEAITEVLTKNGNNGTYLERLVIRNNGRITFLRASDINWIAAAGDYLELHSDCSTSLVRARIGDVEKKLDPRRFIRVHRSAIVNIERIKELHPLFHGDLVIILGDKTEVPVSRKYREKLEQLLDRGL